MGTSENSTGRGNSRENSTGKEVRCDYCGCAFVPEILTEMDGGIAYTFFRCDYCGKAHMIGVSDQKLRSGIAKYLFLAQQHEGKTLTEEENRMMQELKAENMKRAAELRKLYLKERGNGGG